MDESQTPPATEPSVPLDTPAPEPQTPNDTPPEPTLEAPVESPVEAPAEPAVPAPEEEEGYTPPPPIPQVAPLDFSNLPVDENNLIDPNALASQINQRIAQAEQNASMRASQLYAEQETEKRQWDKAFEKYPDLKTNKDLQSLVHQARLGEVTDILSRSNNPNDLKLPTPSQVADKVFKHISTQKAEGFKQANQNTIVQQSGTLESSGKASDSEAEATQSNIQNLNNPNKEVANKARNALLRKKLGWD